MTLDKIKAIATRALGPSTRGGSPDPTPALAHFALIMVEYLETHGDFGELLEDVEWWLDNNKELFK